MRFFSRREALRFGAAAAALGAAVPAGLAEVPHREKKHGRGHVHHHTYYEAGGAAPDSLNGLARDKGLGFGAAIGMAGRRAAKPAHPKPPEPAAYDDPQLRALFIAQCGILVPENELKWNVLRANPKGFDFSRADALVAFADRYQMAMRGHTLLWNKAQHLPEWVLKYDFGANPAAEAERMLKEHIKTVCRRYGERIFSYDVVNETISPQSGEIETSPFTKILGPEVVDLCFQVARESAPKAQLVYNDNMGWSPKDAAHRAGVLKLLERLKKANAPIDALGIQSHITPVGIAPGSALGDADVVEWRKFLDAVVAMGIDIAVTEFTVNDRFLTGTIAERDKAAADYAKAYLDIVLSYPQTRYVVSWGLSDKFSTLPEALPRPDGLAKRVLPYDENFRPKPLRGAIAQALAAAPARPLLPMKPA